MVVELVKQVRRLRTRLGLGAMVGLPALLALVFWLGRGQAPERGAPQDIFALATRSGLNFAAASLEAMGRFFLVVVVALFAGEPVAGEANWGTLRYLLVRPVPRPRLLRDKLVVSMLLGTVAILLVPLAGMAAGTIAFGWGRLQIPFGSLGTGPALTRLVEDRQRVPGDRRVARLKSGTATACVDLSRHRPRRRGAHRPPLRCG